MTSGPPRILITRAAEDADGLVQAIAGLGLQPVLVPLLTRLWRIEEVSALATRVPDADWLLLTSGAVIDVVAAAAPRAWRQARIAAVGPQTARRAHALGYEVHATTAGTGMDLVAALGSLAGKKIALPRGDLAGDDLPAALRGAGAEVFEAVAYDNACPHDAGPSLQRALPVDATTLLSGSAATRLAELLPGPDRDKLGRIAVIGPSTRDAARAAGLSVDGMARPHTAQAVISLIAGWFGR